MAKVLTKKKSEPKIGGLAKASRKKTLLLLSMVAPGTIWLLLLRYLPIGGIIMAFQNYTIHMEAPSFINNIVHSAFVGLNNFKFLFLVSDTWVMIRNTLLYNIVFIVLGLIIPVAFAVMLNELTSKPAAKVYQTLMFFPYFLSWVVASYFLQAFLDPTRGLLVNLLESWGVPPIDFYNDTTPWPFILTLCNVWKNTGYSAILYLAAITGIDASEYEAASIDGASKWKQIRYVTLPHLKPMMIMLFIMNIGKIFCSDFGLFFNIPLQSGPLFPVTQVVDTYVYRAMTSTQNYGMSTAAGLLQNVIGFSCVMIANSIVKKIDPDSALF